MHPQLRPTPMRNYIATLLVTLSLGLVTLAQPRTATPALDEVPNGKLIASYIAAFNAGEDAMAVFIKNNVADTALQARSIEARLATYRQMHQRLKTLEIQGIVNVMMSAGEQSVTALVRTGAGEKISLTFNFDPAPPNKLISLRVEDVDDGPQASQSGPGDGAAIPPISQPEFIRKMTGYLDDAAQHDKFSGVVLIAHQGKPILQKAYGFADQEKKIPNNITTKFNLGSINKMFTRLCIDQLVSQGKLGYDDKLGKFLPDYPNHEAAEKVTIRQLLTMKSGIGDFFGERYEATPKQKLRSLADYLPLFGREPLLFEPGTKQQYSNGGYIVLGLIIEKISGTSYYDFVKEHVFKLAGMNDTDFYLTGQIVANRAEGYTIEKTNGAGRRNNRFSRPERGSSAGGGYSTAADLLSFTRAIASGKLSFMSPETGQPVHESMGVGGGAPGINAALEFDPATRNVIIVLSNYDPPAAQDIAKKMHQGIKAIRD